ncbi:cytochrome c [Undibacterium amnicola]|uniref:Cytochrome c n=1 Tax=Undibacterium amnicola TaxID=1834038 RepID=A0ABR6XT94_9BURK|nr:cytochrome c [Undibacterium amnicola]MBC3832722.1 cytochrome c [Undibacterium amnicola]
MPQLKKILAPLLTIAILSGSAVAVAQNAPKPEQLIKWRQSAFQVIAWNNGRVKANVEGTYNKEEVVKAANTIAAVANAGLGSLFAPGSDKGKGWHDTSTKPEAFTDKRFGELAGNFIKEANELAKVAANSDQAAVKAQFGALGKTCKACHDDFKTKD